MREENQRGLSTQTRTRKQALTEGVIAGILFGTAAIFIRFIQDMDTFSIVFWRLILGCLALALILVVFGKSFQFNVVRRNLRELLILGAFLGLHFIFFTFSVKDTTILNATVLVNTVPIFSMLISSFVFRSRPSQLALVSLVVSFAGIFLIAYGEVMNVTATSGGVTPTLKGDSEAILAAVVESFYLNYGKKIRSRMNILSTMLPIYMFAAVIAGVLSVPIKNGVLLTPIMPETALPLIGLGLLPTAIAHTLYFSSLSNLKSFETATMAFLEPVGATILGIGVFREVPAPVFGLGAILVLVGIFFTIQNRG